jgi:SAM-dependent methyltransferase
LDFLVLVSPPSRTDRRTSTCGVTRLPRPS